MLKWAMAIKLFFFTKAVVWNIWPIDTWPAKEMPFLRRVQSMLMTHFDSKDLLHFEFIRKVQKMWLTSLAINAKYYFLISEWALL